MSKKGGHVTPDELDYLFERDIIDEGDYIQFWSEYWPAKERGQEQRVILDWLQLAADVQEEESSQPVGTTGPVSTPAKLAGIVTRNKQDAIKQAEAIGGRVVRRNANGRFSKRGRSFQAVIYPSRSKKK